MGMFTTRYGSKIAGILSGFDRLIFRGTLRQLSHANGLEGYLKWAGILLKDFREGAWRISEEGGHNEDSGGRTTSDSPAFV